MRIFEVVIFLLTISIVHCANVDNKTKEIVLKQEENHPSEGKSEGKQTEFNHQFEYKLKLKKYQPPQPKEIQYMIIKRTHDVPSKKYVLAHSSSEFVTHHNNHPTKISYSVVHKPKPKIVKVVQNGPVKHIYLDMPKVSLPKEQSLKSSEFEPINNAGSNHHYEFEVGQNFNKLVKHNNVFSNTQNNPNVLNGFEMVSSGYRVGKTNNINPVIYTYASQYAPKYLNNLGNNLISSPVKYGPQTFISQQSISTTPATTPAIPSRQYGFSAPQQPASTEKGTIKYEIPQISQNVFDSFKTNQNVQDFVPSVSNFGQGQTNYVGQVNNISNFDQELLKVVNKSEEKQPLNLQYGYSFGHTQPVLQNSFNDQYKLPQNFVIGPSSFSHLQTQNKVEASPQIVNTAGLTPQFLSNYQNSYSYAQYPQVTPTTEVKYSFEDIQPGKQTFKTNAYHIQHEFVPSISDIAQTEQTYGFATEKVKNITEFQEIPQTSANQFLEYPSQQIVQTTQEEKPKLLYQISQEFKPVFDNTPYSTNHNIQSQNFVPITPTFSPNPQFSTAQTESISPAPNYEPELATIVNAINNGEGYTTPDGFKMIKSPTDKAIYLVGQPGMSLDTIPNLAAFGFGSQQSLQTEPSNNAKFLQ